MEAGGTSPAMFSSLAASNMADLKPTSHVDEAAESSTHPIRRESTEAFQSKVWQDEPSVFDIQGE